MLWQSRSIAIDGGRGGIDHSFHFFIPRCNKDIQSPSDIDGIGCFRVLCGSLDRWEGSLVEYILDSLDRFLAGTEVTNISLDRLQRRGCFIKNEVLPFPS